MIPDINIFTPEVLATLVNINGDILVETKATCILLNGSDNLSSCSGCPFNFTIAGCIDKHYQILLAEHFPELFV